LPAAEEVRLGQRFLRTQTDALTDSQDPTEALDTALVDFVHALFNTNEFLFVD
jgi:hypothetical protein